MTAKTFGFLARKAEALALSAHNTESLQTIWQLYATQLRDFFSGPRNLAAHLGGSHLPLKRLCHEIESSESAVEVLDRDKLLSLKTLAVEKDKLDDWFAHQGLLRVWTFVHVPATYALIVVTLLHVAIVYAFSAGVP